MCGSASRTIEIWVWDPQLQDEKTVISWGHRGGAPDGSNCTFGHGVHATWGFLGGWGYADIGCTNVPSIVVRQRWTYTAYTYDNATRIASIYQDGVLLNAESYSVAQVLKTWTNLNDNVTPIPFRVARQTEAGGVVSGCKLPPSSMRRRHSSNLTTRTAMESKTGGRFATGSIPTVAPMPLWTRMLMGQAISRNSSAARCPTILTPMVTPCRMARKP
jgi:hypothetical protein